MQRVVESVVSVEKNITNMLLIYKYIKITSGGRQRNLKEIGV